MNKEKLINGTLAALLEREGDQSTIPAADLENQFQALRRLVASKAGFGAFTQLPKSVFQTCSSTCPPSLYCHGVYLTLILLTCFLCYSMREKVGLKVVKALKRHDDGVTHAALDMLSALVQVRTTYISWIA